MAGIHLPEIVMAALWHGFSSSRVPYQFHGVHGGCFWARETPTHLVEKNAGHDMFRHLNLDP